MLIVFPPHQSVKTQFDPPADLRAGLPDGPRHVAGTSGARSCDDMDVVADFVQNGLRAWWAPALAFAAGVVSFASPCVLPLVPGYLFFITGQGTASGPG